MTAAGDCIRAALIGVGGTILLDLWALFVVHVLRTPATNWRMVGRWIGNMPHGYFVHETLAKAGSVSGEAAIGWAAHYLIGVSYGVLLLALWGRAWMLRPTVLPPMILSWVLLVAPYFIMMPGMGSGVAGSKTPKPNLTRLKSAMSHSIFGLGMFATALALARG